MKTPDFEDLVEAFLEKCRAEENPDMGAFVAAHPEHAEKLRELLPLVREMEGLKKRTSDPENEGDGERTSDPEVTSDFGVTTVPDPAEELAEGEIPALEDTDFQLLREIGRGGMGVVYEANQRSLNRKVAVKLLSRRLLAEVRLRKQFEQESRVIAMLHHPNIVQIFSAGSEADFCYYAMELIDGRGLNHCQFRDLREIARIGTQAARALAYAHRCKVMHRDIKPANILLDAHREPYISDFGIACILPDSLITAEYSGDQSGTLRYMAPERLNSGVETFASDLYSLGATLYELVSGSPMLTASTAKEMIQKIRRGKIPPLKCSEPDLAAIIHKCLRFRPQDRYASMDALANDLQRFLNYEPIRGAKVPVFRRLKLWIHRKPAVAVMSLVSALCTVAFVAAMAVGIIQTSLALRRAEENARIADTVLMNVFEHVETQIPSQSGTRLLEKLLPYYRNITQQRNPSPGKIAEAHEMIGMYALRAGNFELAESEFRQLAELRADAASQNRLADALRRQGKKTEADALSREIAKLYAKSKLPADRYEAVRALRALAFDASVLPTENAPESPELLQAFQIIQELLQQDLQNPKYRYEYAVLLGSNPRLFQSQRIPGVEPNAITVLNSLAAEAPENYEYGLALVNIMYRKLTYSRRVRERDQEALTVALKMSDSLLGRFPNTREVVAAVIRFRLEYVNTLRRDRQENTAQQESERLLGMLEILCCGPEVPDIVHEVLIQSHLKRLETVLRTGSSQKITRMTDDLEFRLKQYSGPRQKEFAAQFSELKQRPSGRKHLRQ